MSSWQYHEGMLLAYKVFDEVNIESGDTFSITFDLSLNDEAKPKADAMNNPRAIFIAPTHAWGMARAKELFYKNHEVDVIPIQKDIRWKLQGYVPDDEAEPVIYLTGVDEFFGSMVDTPAKRELRNAIKTLRMKGFEIIDLDEVGIIG